MGFVRPKMYYKVTIIVINTPTVIIEKHSLTIFKFSFLLLIFFSFDLSTLMMYYCYFNIYNYLIYFNNDSARI